jgi:uncharacterized Zn finger protein (UPF0148 family)
MATTQCPACGLTVPFFCCEGLVCPACGYDEAEDAVQAPGGSAGQVTDLGAAEALHGERRMIHQPRQ